MNGERGHEADFCDRRMVVGAYQCRDDRQEFVMEQRKEAMKV